MTVFDDETKGTIDQTEYVSFAHNGNRENASFLDLCLYCYS